MTDDERQEAERVWRGALANSAISTDQAIAIIAAALNRKWNEALEEYKRKIWDKIGHTERISRMRMWEIMEDVIRALKKTTLQTQGDKRNVG